jgi:hypothetical protein
MSRGLGQTQRFVMTLVEEHPDWVIPAPLVAELYAVKTGVPLTAHLRSSIRRAIDKLAQAGLVSAREMEVAIPITTDRWGKRRSQVERHTLCVTRGGVEYEDFNKPLPVSVVGSA